MRLELIKPAASLNKAYRKTSLKRNQIELFKENLKRLFDRFNKHESEEHLKNIVSDFLKDTWYKNLNEINTKGRADLVIHNGKSSSDNVGVIFEVKRPVNKSEMISVTNPNEKALHELLNYYLDERYIKNNKEIKHLIVTNINEWFIFDGADFERFFFENQKLTKQYKDWHDGLFGVKLNEWFYQEIAKPFIEKELPGLKCTWFNLKNFETIIRNEDKSDDLKLIDLYKTLSPEHLLKKPFANDSNSLDKAFYTELLHIIGLTETKEGNKKLIGRKKEGQRDAGSLIENAIIQIDSRDMINRLENPSGYGETHQERLFNVSLDLVITWIDRILFLKLLEAQLIKYHKGDSSYSFLTNDKMKGYDALDSLFFRVLAKKTKERDPAVIKLFEKVPYLNSSLFEPTELERDTIFISNLQDECMIPFHPGTVLKNNTGKRLTGTLNGLDYLFAFLDAYDFSGEGTEGIQEDNKTLINASVLGLIFEKINGYKDGSFFTPGFITMYMCRETIRRAVVQKFNDLKGWNCQSLKEVYDKIEDRKEANDIVNSLKICDPGVGSGHFLVSSLNEIIAIKSELKILLDREGKRLKEYHVEVANDELIITDEDSELYEYNPKSPESQRVQEALFHEKQTIIENCLFGVDINPNSVKICRLRLWIELLKNSYYTDESNYTELETLPNIDINIKCGNSLISRYSLDADIKQALKKSKWSIDSYRLAVMMYRNATSKEQKREMERLIESIKTDFETEVAANDNRLLQVKKLNGDLFNLTNQTSLFERSKKELADWNKKVNELTAKIKNLETELEEIINNKIYENAFEWRFEFPEVLNDEGDFVGFDIVIGNPPYFIMTKQNMNISLLHFLLTEYVSIKNSSSKNIFPLFIEKGISLLNHYGQQAMIVPEGLFSTRSYSDCVNFMNSQGVTETITTIEGMIFEEATTGNLIFIFGKSSESKTERFHFNDFQTLVPKPKEDLSLIHKISSVDSVTLVKDVCELFKGMVVKDRKTVVFIEYNENLKNKFLLGNCISKWKIHKYEYTDYNSLTIIGGTKLKRKHDIFPRILIRRTGDYLCCAYLEEPALTESTLYSCWTKSTDFNNKYILALFHSKLFDYYIKKLMITNKQAFPQILMTDIENLPLKRISDIDQDVFISKIDEILSVKKSDPTANTRIIEKEIDQLVYELYGLTEEEIKIVEGTSEQGV
jgi:adenine-specific DNA-methyltransferase